jgi:hypothetical protein
MNVESGSQQKHIEQEGNFAAVTLPPPPLTPKEFGQRYNKSASFAYRMIYSGRVRVIPGIRMMIPISEVIRFESQAIIYNGRRPRRKRRA